MDSQTYYAIARWLTGLSETCLESRFGERHSDIAPCPQNEPTATFPLQEPANELPWYWAYFPYLDAPEKQKESALHAGYIKVTSKSEADKVIAEKDRVIAELERQIEFLKVTHDACGNCNKCADGMGKVFDKYINEHKIHEVP